MTSISDHYSTGNLLFQDSYFRNKTLIIVKQFPAILLGMKQNVTSHFVETRQDAMVQPNYPVMVLRIPKDISSSSFSPP